MVKFWTPTKIIVTILITIVLLLILFKLGIFNFMNLDTLFTSGDSAPQIFSGAPSGGGSIT